MDRRMDTAYAHAFSRLFVIPIGCLVTRPRHTECVPVNNLLLHQSVAPVSLIHQCVCVASTCCIDIDNGDNNGNTSNVNSLDVLTLDPVADRDPDPISPMVAILMLLLL